MRGFCACAGSGPEGGSGRGTDGTASSLCMHAPPLSGGSILARDSTRPDFWAIPTSNRKVLRGLGLKINRLKCSNDKILCNW